MPPAKPEKRTARCRLFRTRDKRSCGTASKEKQKERGRDGARRFYRSHSGEEGRIKEKEAKKLQAKVREDRKAVVIVRVIVIVIVIVIVLIIIVLVRVIVIVIVITPIGMWMEEEKEEEEGVNELRLRRRM